MNLVVMRGTMQESTTYAIIKSGSKQYRVKVGDIIDIDLVDHEPGHEVEFTNILFVSNAGNGKEENSILFGNPVLNGFSVKGKLHNNIAGPKVVGLRYKASHNQRRKWGHRQKYSRVEIIEIAETKKSKG